MKKIINPWRNHPEYNCFGCCPENPIGLHMEFYEDGDYIVSNWHPQRNYQGWVNTMHGGILSTLIDEVCGWVVTRKLQTSGYTVQLNVKFKKAIPTTEPLLPISAAAKGVLWTVLFGMAKTCQYGGLTILGVEGYQRLKDWLKRRKRQPRP